MSNMSDKSNRTNRSDWSNKSNWSDKSVLIAGLGLYTKGSGISAAKFFIKQGARLVITDLKSKSELKDSAAEIDRYYKKLRHQNKNIFPPKYVLGKHRPMDFRTADLVFQNPSMPADSPFLKIARKNHIPILNDWTIFLLRHNPKIFVGITGTRGKSTTAALIYEILKKKYKKVILAGNLGVSPLDFVDLYKGEPIVAELSSWLLHHFPAARQSPQVAVVTNILKDHLDKYPGMKEYIADKKNIFRFQNKKDILILNYDNPVTRRMAKKARGRVICFSLKKHLPRWLPFRKVKLLGEHNLQNILAACAAAEAMRIPRKTIIPVIKNFRGIPNRLELVRKIDGVSYYNDTTATTPDATIAALVALGRTEERKNLRTEKHIILIAGGSDKKLDYKNLAYHIKRYCKAVVLFEGTASQKIYRLISQYPNIPISISIRSMSEAVRRARQFAVRGDTILLSPAAASFGLFKNEFDRGRQFVKTVKAI